MPLARSWVEELVAEYLMLRGMLAVVDVKVGGRRDIDVVAVDPRDRVVLLVDVKGDWSGSADDICRGVVERLSQGEELFRKVYGDGWRFRKLFILIDLTASRSKIEEIKSRLEPQGIEVKTLSTLIKEALSFIDEWRASIKKLGLAGEETKPAIPENLYLLKVLEFLRDKNMVRT